MSPRRHGDARFTRTLRALKTFKKPLISVSSAKLVLSLSKYPCTRKADGKDLRNTF